MEAIGNKKKQRNFYFTLQGTFIVIQKPMKNVIRQLSLRNNYLTNKILVSFV